MTNQDHDNFARLMALLQEVFVPTKPISKEKVTIYFDILKDYEFDEINSGCKRIVKSKLYSTFPLPAEILDQIEPEKSGQYIIDRANEGWALAKQVIITGGSSGDEILDEAIRIAFGDWNGFGNTDPNNEPSDRKHFLACYRIAAQRIIEQRLLNPEPKERLLK